MSSTTISSDMNELKETEVHLLKQAETDEKTFLQKHGQKLIAGGFWLSVVVGTLAYMQVNDLTLADTLRQLANVLTSPIGALVYVVLYTLRPVLFFPATLITLAGGAIFGPVWGIVWVVIGSNAGAMLAYLIGRYFGDGLIDETEAGGIVAKYANRMRRNSFETVMIMRFLFLPYDLVNYLSGILKIDWKAFLLGTMIGCVPGTIAFTLAGASFGSLEQALSGEPPSFQWQTLAISAAMFAASMVLSRYFKRREGVE